MTETKQDMKGPATDQRELLQELKEEGDLNEKQEAKLLEYWGGGLAQRRAIPLVRYLMYFVLIACPIVSLISFFHLSAMIWFANLGLIFALGGITLMILADDLELRGRLRRGDVFLRLEDMERFRRINPIERRDYITVFIIEGVFYTLLGPLNIVSFLLFTFVVVHAAFAFQEAQKRTEVHIVKLMMGHYDKNGGVSNGS